MGNGRHDHAEVGQQLAHRRLGNVLVHPFLERAVVPFLDLLLAQCGDLPQQVPKGNFFLLGHGDQIGNTHELLAIPDVDGLAEGAPLHLLSDPLVELRHRRLLAQLNQVQPDVHPPPLAGIAVITHRPAAGLGKAVQDQDLLLPLFRQNRPDTQTGDPGAHYDHIVFFS